jgi:hypothetical protein
MGKLKCDYTYKNKKSTNFLLDFVPKELIYIKNNNSKQVLDLTPALCTSVYVRQQHLTE